MKVLLPIDDSPVVKFAIKRVLAEKWPEGSEFKVVTVVEPLEQILPGPDPQYMPHAKIVRQDVVDAAALRVSQAARQLEAQFGASSVRAEVLEGLPADRIVTAACEWPADLIVIGSHGRSMLSRILLGSVAETVVLWAPCSVEIVHPMPSRRGMREQGQQSDNVLIAIDTSELAAHVVNEVLRRPWPDTCNFKLVTVLKPLYALNIGDSGINAPGLFEKMKQSEESARTILNEKLKELEKAFGQTRVTGELLKGEIKPAILNEARRSAAGLIVVGSHGRTGAALGLLGSISLGVIQEAPSSVLVVKSAGQKAKTTSISGNKRAGGK